MIWLIYNLLFPIGFLFMLPKFISRMLRRGGYGRHFEQRLGIFGRGVKAQLAGGGRIWIHAVSVGELFIALRYIEEHRRLHAGVKFVLSTTTSTGHALAGKKLHPDDILIYFPVDLPVIIRRVFNLIRPQQLILVEGEFWPNLVRRARKLGIPVALINGRVSDSSFKGYMRLRPFTRRLLEMIDPVCVQSKRDAERIIKMGARPETVKILGTAKYDLPPPSPDAAVAARNVLNSISVPENALILLGGSTWPGEEAALCRVYKKLREKIPALFLVLVPRHAERRDEIVKAIDAENLSFVLRSKKIDAASPRPDVLVIDTTGELMNFYAVADLVFVGKSLCEHGGQNPIEPALFGKAIIVGPNMENFPLVMDDFRTAGAICQVADVSEFAAAVEKYLIDSAARAQLGTAAAGVVERNRGVITKMVTMTDS